MNGRKWMNLLAVLSVGALHAESVFATASSTVKSVEASNNSLLICSCSKKSNKIVYFLSVGCAADTRRLFSAPS